MEPTNRDILTHKAPHHKLSWKENPSVFMLYLMLYFTVSVLILSGIIYLMIESGASSEIFTNMWFIIAMQVNNFIVSLFIWLKITGGKFSLHMPRQAMGIKNYIYVFFLTLLVMPISMTISGITSFFVDNDIAVLIGDVAGAGNGWLIMLLAFAVTPSIVEEISFRGYIQSIQEKRMRRHGHASFAKIAVMNGFLFGLMHLNLHQFMYTFLVGILFAYIVYATRSVIAGIFSHFVLNGTQVSLLQLVMRFDNAVAESPELAAYDVASDLFTGINEEVFAIALMGFIAIFTTIGGVALFKRFWRHNMERNSAIDAAKEMVIQKPTDDMQSDELTVEQPSLWSRIDWWLVACVVVYGFAVWLFR